MRQGRGRGRAPTGPWGRLKPVDQDPLESVGLPSKGDTRLLDFKAQERYYTKIVERYMTFCSDAGERDELLRRFAALDLTDPTASINPPKPASHNPLSLSNLTMSASSSLAPSSRPLPLDLSTKPLSDVLSALRKLREGIVASHRADDFAIQVYLFNIRLSVLVKHPESYHPAILHLLRSLHPRQPLTSVEHAEVTSYLVLDAACRRSDLAAAYAMRKQYGLKDQKVDAALAALAHDNYFAFRRVRRAVDGHRARLMELADVDMRTHALKCFGRSYLSVDKGYLEKCTDATWDELTTRDGVGWELEGEKVIIRKVKGR